MSRSRRTGGAAPDDRASRRLPSGGVDPSASHGDPARPAPPVRQSSSGVPTPAPAARGGTPACTLFRNVTGHRMTLTFREVERRALPDEEAPVILIIDDDHLTRDSLAATLSIEGFDVITASTGAEGIALRADRLPGRW